MNMHLRTATTLHAPFAIAVISGEVRTGYVVDEDNKPSLSWSYAATLELCDRLNAKSTGHARFAIEGTEIVA